MKFFQLHDLLKDIIRIHSSQPKICARTFLNMKYKTSENKFKQKYGTCPTKFMNYMFNLSITIGFNEFLYCDIY